MCHRLVTTPCERPRTPLWAGVMPSPLLFPRCLLTSPGGEAADVVARDVKTPVTSLVGGLGARLVGSRSFDKAPARFVSATPPTQHPSHHSHLQSVTPPNLHQSFDHKLSLKQQPQCFALPSPALSAPPRLPARSATLSASWLLATPDPSVLAARRLRKFPHAIGLQL